MAIATWVASCFINSTFQESYQCDRTDGINEVTEKRQIAYAFPKLRCTFGQLIQMWRLFVDKKIEFDDNGEPIDDVLIAPNWTIEILSPVSSNNQVKSNILHCLKYGF